MRAAEYNLFSFVATVPGAAALVGALGAWSALALVTWQRGRRPGWLPRRWARVLAIVHPLLPPALALALPGTLALWAGEVLAAFGAHRQATLVKLTGVVVGLGAMGEEWLVRDRHRAVSRTQKKPPVD